MAGVEYFQPLPRGLALPFHQFRICPMKNRLLTTSFAAIAFSQGVLQAQTTATLDGTAGSNSISTAYSTNGGLNLSLGFVAEYLILGGGGGGGGLYHAGGGGAGGLLTGSGSLTAQSYAITVGAGGTGGSGFNGLGGNGGNSTALGLSAIGGGGGGAESQIGKNGGSGGGNGWTSGLTNVGLGTAGQGYNGGLGDQNTVFPANGRNSGGGGGGSGVGISALINGSTDIATSSRPMKASETQKLKARFNSLGVEIPCAKDGISIYVNKANGISELTVKQIGQIFSGEITNL